MNLFEEELKTLICNALNETVNTEAITFESFSGYNANELLNWLINYEIFADARGWNEKQRLLKVGCHLSDSARQWYILNVKLAKPADQPDTWAEFVELITGDLLPGDFKTNVLEEIESK